MYNVKMSISENIYILLLLMSYVIKKAGTFSMKEKIKMIEFISHVAQNPDANSKDLLQTYMQRLT
jgi:hypothetical protein